MSKKAAMELLFKAWIMIEEDFKDTENKEDALNVEMKVLKGIILDEIVKNINLVERLYYLKKEE